MTQLVILGSVNLQLKQFKALQRLATQHQLPPVKAEFDKRWTPGREGLLCSHLEVIGITVGLAASRPFLIAAMKLPGVYMECPEHCKRKFWEQNEATLAEQSGATLSKVATRIQRTEGPGDDLPRISRK